MLMCWKAYLENQGVEKVGIVSVFIEIRLMQESLFYFIVRIKGGLRLQS